MQLLKDKPQKSHTVENSNLILAAASRYGGIPPPKRSNKCILNKIYNLKYRVDKGFLVLHV